MYHAVPVFRSPIGNMDALSFLNSAIVVYVEIRVSGGTPVGRESAGRGTVGIRIQKARKIFLRAFYMHQAVGEAGC